MGYRTAIIGCGRIAWMLEDDPLDVKPCTHMGAYLSEAGMKAGIEVVAASDINMDRLDAFGKRFGITGLYGDYREMLKRETPDIVSVCGYATERYPMVMEGIRAGVRGIWCEKAFAASVKEARLMVEACTERGVELIVSHMRRWSGEYRAAKEMVDAGMIGELLSVACLFSGSLVHTGTHAFDVLRWFCGPISWVEGALEGSSGGFSWDSEEDRGGRALIQFENGYYATVHAEAKKYFLFEFDIFGTEGRIRIGNNGLLEYYTPKESRHYTGLRELYPAPFPVIKNKENWWVGALTNLVEAMEKRGANLSTPEDGLRALEAALAVHMSAKKGGKRVELPIKKTSIRVRST
ncbi:MAG: Gfo/Idh/MocA family oxidoreductase [Deltaproteobacteria bacterium]|nr:Gfo/Idh/MocA family oxidoreductase [Deltaproteobacteria bacterium]